ncbi:hypothetical protein [Halovivax gelatinilyticus]|uniref:hypothetical protein n=1 Tax=Halovivax gelatinilyticus TaxID=2961597 RepID=UPI0020CA3A3B|nr:hypothetical protein [Halovivax gelatinilyticus]
MTGYERRALLRYGGLGLGVGVAGCLGELPGTGGDEDLSVDVFQLGPTGRRPPWDDEERRGSVTSIESAEDLPWTLHFDDEPGVADDPDSDDDSDSEHDGASPAETVALEPEDVADWFDETDFDESVVFAVQTVGPNTCYGEVAIDDVEIATERVESVDEDREVLAATATAIDVSEPETACGQAVTYPSALVRVTPTDPDIELPVVAQFTIVDGWGDSSVEDSIRGVLGADDVPGFAEPPGDPTVVPPALECPNDDFERLPSHRDEEVVYGETVDDDGRPLYAMRAANPQVETTSADPTEEEIERALTFEYGDEIEIVLRNVSNGRPSVGNKHKYNFELLTEDGWQDVRGTDPETPFGYTDEAYLHPPGEGFDWSFTLTEGGLLEDGGFDDYLRVCPDLQPGRYRFRFWSVAGAESLAVAFDLVDTDG